MSNAIDGRSARTKAARFAITSSYSFVRHKKAWCETGASLRKNLGSGRLSDSPAAAVASPREKSSASRGDRHPREVFAKRSFWRPPPFQGFLRAHPSRSRSLPTRCSSLECPALPQRRLVQASISLARDPDRAPLTRSLASPFSALRRPTFSIQKFCCFKMRAG